MTGVISLVTGGFYEEESNTLNEYRSSQSTLVVAFSKSVRKRGGPISSTSSISSTSTRLVATTVRYAIRGYNQSNYDNPSHILVILVIPR